MKEQILSYMREEAYRPLNYEDLAHALNIEDFKLFSQALRELEQEGYIIVTKKHRYGLAEKMGYILGTIQGHKKGFAFLLPEDKNLKDYFISPDDLGGAVHGDRVLAQQTNPSSPKSSKEVTVMRVLKRAQNMVVGTLQMATKGFGFVIPDEKKLSQDIFVSRDDFHGAKDGDKVVVTITKWPDQRRSPEGVVAEVLGKAGQPGVDIISIVRKFKLPEEFPPEILQEAERISDTVPEEAYAERKDLRQMQMVTIDGADAKDLDDAVSLQVLDNGNYLLGVHIADVGYYVKVGSELDQEAFNRATSVYLVDRVIPMLPKKLSNGICSLNPKVDRLAMTCMMEVNGKGDVVKHDIFPSVINIEERMTYDDVRKILVEDDQPLIERYKKQEPMFREMEKLCHILKARRADRGAIDFEFPESKVILDEDGKPVEIVKRIRSISEMVIEEFMLLANETVAEHMFWLDAPFVYRVHEEPDVEDLYDLNEFLNTFGYKVKTNEAKIKPHAYQSIISKIKGRPEEKTISKVMLRSMKHARYAEQSLGHFGLSAEYYCHFTSPIRRYPDLAIHRIIREYLTNNWAISEKRKNKLMKIVPEYAAQSSIREKVAEEAERESVDLKMVEYMERHLGEIFEGTISSVTNFGFFVELDNLVEGLVRVASLQDDYYTFIDKHLTLLGQHTKKTYKIGDRVTILVAKVNTAQREIDFEIVEENE
jgi:ribonuclease R